MPRKYEEAAPFAHVHLLSRQAAYTWLKELGLKVETASAALVPISLEDPAVGASGVSMKNAKITVFQNEAKQEQALGKILFTHVGLSGPAILNMSRAIGELLKYDSVFIEVDLLPDMGYEKVNEGLQDAFRENSNKLLRNSLKSMIPAALTQTVLQKANVDGELLCNAVTRDARVRLMKTIKHCRFKVKGLLGMDKAVITSGGLALTEMDFKTMRSNKYKNLYVVGDMLNIDRPSGGYSLQLCWTTGYVAGTHAASA
jgi:predicted Rossmann fold flavoprotein